MGVTIRVEIEEEVLARAVEALEGTSTTLEEVLAARLRELAEEVPPLELAPADDEEYAAWVDAKVREALDDPRPLLSQAEVMREIDRLLDDLDRARA